VLAALSINFSPMNINRPLKRKRNNNNNNAAPPAQRRRLHA
jgi:hypothetical protein